MNKKIRNHLFVLIYLFFLVIVGRLLFAVPNHRYLNILNYNTFYIISCSISICVFVILQFLKMSKLKKMILLCVTTFTVFSVIGTLYYLNLPKYTYEEAAKKILDYEIQNGKLVHIKIPEYREEKIGHISNPFFKTTNYIYYIYLETKDDLLVYKFNPLDGTFQKDLKKQNLIK